MKLTLILKREHKMKKLIVTSLLLMNLSYADKLKEYYNCMAAKHYFLTCGNDAYQYDQAYASGSITKKQHDKMLNDTDKSLKCTENSKKYILCAPKYDPDSPYLR